MGKVCYVATSSGLEHGAPDLSIQEICPCAKRRITDSMKAAINIIFVKLENNINDTYYDQEFEPLKMSRNLNLERLILGVFGWDLYYIAD